MQNTNKFWQLLELCDATLLCSARGIWTYYLPGRRMIYQDCQVILIFVFWTLGQMSRPPEYSTGSHESSDPGVHSFRWRWPDKVSWRPNNAKSLAISLRGQWSPCIMCFGSFLIVSLLARRKKREMPSHGPDEKQQNIFRHTDRLTNTWFEIPWCFCLPANDEGWWWLSVFSTAVQGPWRCKWASKNISFPQSTYVT